MADLICKYCGEKNPHFSHYCSKSPTGKHILLPTGNHCVYCGEENPNMSHACRINNSPTGRHRLVE